MAFRKFVPAVVVIAVLLLLASCAQVEKSACDTNAKNFTLQASNSTPLTNSQPQLTKSIDLNSEAASLSATPGKVALSLIICRLDNSRVLEELCKKSAQELLSIISEIAQQKSQTLESLNNQYDLTDILASEGIYISIASNAIKPDAAQSSAGSNWIAKFQTAINAGN